MPNLLDNIQSCQYNDTIATGDTIGKVKSVDSTRVDVDVTPVIEGGRKVYTAVELILGDSDQESIVTSEVAPAVSVARAGIGTEIYGALETVNTATQRCGVLTDGIVIFRNSILSTPDNPEDSDIGKSIRPPVPASVTPSDNNGCITVGADSNIGKGTILSYVGQYFLVDLKR